MYLCVVEVKQLSLRYRGDNIGQKHYDSFQNNSCRARG